MLLPRTWLDEFVPVSDVSDAALSHALTMSGSKVEAVTSRGEEIANVVAGKILSIAKHENAEKLLICKVDVGSDAPLQIVTGATNLSEGDVVPVALHGATLPGGVTIRKGKLRGETSDGMLCSIEELSLTHGDYPDAPKDGIFILPESAAPGRDVKILLGLDESVIEFEITSNRPDCLSVIGLARETAATLRREWSVPTPPASFRANGADTVEDHLRVDVLDPDLCLRYSAKVVKNLRIAPSPEWMRRRLASSGVRPINNIVDITNYVMLEYGQPMHAFDSRMLGSSHIVVRRAQPSESIETLDGQERTLQDSMLVIADESRPVGVAGVMGGANSEIQDDTATVVFESACFAGASVRLTAKGLGLRTESSSRFEKGLDPMNTIPALRRACELVERLGAGDVVPGEIDVFPGRGAAPVTLPLEVDRINRLLGLPLSKEKMVSLLARLGITEENGTLTLPTFRTDLRLTADIAEEVARLYGYDRIPITQFAGAALSGGLNERQRFEQEVQNLCRALSFDEAYTHSIISPKTLQKGTTPPPPVVHILNPLGEEFSIMRPWTLPSILLSLSLNQRQANEQAHLFELGVSYRPALKNDETVDSATLPEEPKTLTLGSYGSFDFYDVKGRIEALLANLRIADVCFDPNAENEAYHPGRSALIRQGEKTLGIFGQLHPATTKAFDLKGAVFAAELPLDGLFSSREPSLSFSPLPKFPASLRDLAIVCRRDIPVAALEACIKKSAGSLLESIALFDVYEGEQMEAGHKSVAFALTFRAKDRTLAVEECDQTTAGILAALQETFEAKLRQ